MFELLLGDAAALIFDDETDFVVRRRLRSKADLRLRRRKLDGVGHQLVEHLQDALFIDKHLHRRRFNAEVDVSLLADA